MKTTTCFLFLSVGISFLLSCEKQPPVSPSPQKPSSELRKITLTATLPAVTKSELQDGEKVLWTPGDKISVFCGSTQAEFISTNTEPAATAEFTGYIEVPSDVSEGQLTLYGVYPYAVSNSVSDGNVAVSLPSEQPAVAGTFAEGLSIAVGKTTGTSIVFYNVCGLVEVSVSREDVKKVSLSGLGGESLAGTLSVNIGADGKPSVSSIAEGNETVSISAPEGAYLTPGAKYYLVVAPTVLSQGVKVGVETDEALMVKRIEKPLEVKRSVVSVLSGVDEGVLPEFVPFADTAFKAYCIANFDTDGDGEISMAEAQAVTRIECREMGISSLAGIKYFTQLTYLDCGNNNISYLDLSDNVLLESLDCRDNKLTSFAPAANTALQWLCIAGNELENLDVSANPSLTDLDLTCCQLDVLDVSNNADLADLRCYGNHLSSLDVTHNTKLRHLGCEINHLTELDLSKNPELQSLACFANELTLLDLTNNPLLESVLCDNNHLVSMDISNNEMLTCVHAFCNQLTELDCSKNAALEDLMCGTNQLTVLDVSNNSNLKILDCPDNPMECVYVPFGHSYETLNYPEGAQLLQKATNTTENFIREAW